MKNQALFSLKGGSKKLKCCLLQFLFGALRVKTVYIEPLKTFVNIDQTASISVLDLQCLFSMFFAHLFLLQCKLN